MYEERTFVTHIFRNGKTVMVATVKK